ncbi:Gamma-aminobutyric acid type B receptor subunit 1 [Mactra antiquata]
MTGDGWIGGGACLPAVQMAIEDINAREDLLINYTLSYNWIDSKCTAGITVYRMFEALNADPPYIMLLGGGCSVSSEATAQVSYLWNLTQFAYGSSSPVLSNRERFPKFFRIVAPDQKLNQARIDILKLFNWKRVATINQALEFFSMVADDFVERVQGTDINIISQEIFVNDPKNRVENMKKHDARIILTSMYEDKARKVLCEAYKVGLYGRKIVWFFVGWFSQNFWRTNLQDVDCTQHEMDLAAEGAFITGHISRNPIAERGLANRTASEFEELFRNYPSYKPETEAFDFVSYQCYDNVWMAALALNCTDTIMRQNGHPKTLDKFTYVDSDINDMIFECLSNMSITGVSGRVLLSDGADPDRMIKIQRIQDGIRQEVGLYRHIDDKGQFEWFEGAIRWEDGIIPRDSTYVTVEETKMPPILYITMSTLSAIGICMAILFFIFNITYRENRFVKLSSPNINNVLLLGCVLCYSTVFFKTMETSNATTCKKIQDYQLLAIICALLAIVIVVLVLWETIDPHRMEKIFLTKEVYMIGNDEEVRLFVWVCRSQHSVYFGWVLYVMQGALLTFGAFLAWETRQVKIEALNDSHEIGLCIYNVVVLSAVGLTLSLLLKEQEILMYGITGGCLILGTTLTQIIIFVPKVHAVKNKTDVAGFRSTAQRTHPATSGISGSGADANGTQQTGLSKC